MSGDELVRAALAARFHDADGAELDAVRDLLDEAERLRAALVDESAHVERLVEANKAAAVEVERLRARDAVVQTYLTPGIGGNGTWADLADDLRADLAALDDTAGTDVDDQGGASG